MNNNLYNGIHIHTHNEKHFFSKHINSNNIILTELSETCFVSFCLLVEELDRHGT